MAGIVDKGLLLLAGVVMGMGSGHVAAPVIAGLCALIIAAFGDFVRDRRWRMTYRLLFVLGCLLLPELWLFLPVLCYDCCEERWVWALFLLSFVLWEATGEVSWMWMFLLPVAVLLGRRAGRIGRLEQEGIRLRDTSTERNLMLQEKNRSLIEKQDYEIHLAMLRERNRIAREIHDNVGHLLSRSILQVGALATVYRQEPIHEQLLGVNETLNLAMNSIRESVHDLYNDSIDLRGSVEEAARGMRQRCAVTLDYDMSPEVPREVKYCFIAIVKEALSNVARHSDADAVTLVLREHPGFYQLVAADNGNSGRTGEQSVQKMNGIGIESMRERVEALQGTFRIQGGDGFRIFVSIPKKNREQRAEGSAGI